MRSSVLAGDTRRVLGQIVGDREPRRLVDDKRVREFDCASWAQLFLKYVLAEPAVTCVIPATGNPDHMKDNLGAGIGTLPDARQRQQIRELWDAL